MKYLHDGTAVEVLHKFGVDGFVVEQIGYSDPDSQWRAHPMFVRKVFDDCPQQKRVKKLNSEIKALQERRRSIEFEVQAFETQHKDRLKKYKGWAPLIHLENFLDGKITHYVLADGWFGDATICTKEEADKDDRIYRGSTRLLSLFGKSDGDLEWKLNRYSDGSGGWSLVIPCLSYEDALRETQKLIDKHCDSTKPNGRAVKLADKYNLTLPEGYRKELKKTQTKAKDDKIAELEKELVAAKATE